MNELVKLHKCKLTETSLVIQSDINFDEWMGIGNFLKQVNKCVLWWLGDWLNFGENKYGEKYSQALDETDHSYGGLRNSAWVSGRIEMSRRRDNLSWSHHYEVAALPENKQDKYLQKAEENNWSRNRLRLEISGKPHVSYNSGDNEWYTPKKYIESVRIVLGEIDLDPASSEKANEIVKASKYFTSQTNGLTEGWFGKAWMNPPYSSDLIGLFTEKFTQHFNNRDISEGIVLVNNATETAWFQFMTKCASSICFPNTRIKYWSPNKEISTPLQGQAFLYFGDSTNFENEFEKYGFCCDLL